MIHLVFFSFSFNLNFLLFFFQFLIFSNLNQPPYKLFSLLRKSLLTIFFRLFIILFCPITVGKKVVNIVIQTAKLHRLHIGPKQTINYSLFFHQHPWDAFKSIYNARHHYEITVFFNFLFILLLLL